MSEKTLWELSKEIVNDQFNLAQEYAASAFRMANEALTELGDIALKLTPISVRVPVDLKKVDIQNYLKKPPQPPTWNFSYPASPQSPDFLAIPGLRNVSFPDFTAALMPPDIPKLPPIISLPTLPSPPEIVAPSIPAVPSYTLPVAPGLILPNLPEIPYPNFPAFDGRSPDPSNLIPPDPQITDGGREFEIIDGLREKIEEMLKGERPAFTQEVEEAISLRESERSLQIHNDAIDRICGEWSKRRLPLPDGVLTALIQEEQLNYTNKRYDVAREILIKGFELTQQTILKAIDAGVQLQGLYMNIADALARRAFEASRAAAEAMIASFNAGLKKYELLLDVFKTKASVFETLIRAEIGKMEFYKAQVESAKLTVEINDAFVKIYMAQLSAVEAVIGIYRSEMEGAKVFTEIQRTRLDAYRTQIESYIAGINAKTSEYQMYRAKIDGETAKVDVFAKQADAYRAEVGAKAAQLSAYTDEIKAYADANKSLASVYSSEVDAFKSIIQGEASKIDAVIKAYVGEVEGYKAEMGASGDYLGLQVKAYEAEVQAIIAEAGLRIKAADMEIRNYEVEAQLKVEAMKGMAQIASSLAIGSLSAINVSAGIDARGSSQRSIGYEERKSWSESTSHEYRYEMPTPGGG